MKNCDDFYESQLVAVSVYDDDLPDISESLEVACTLAVVDSMDASEVLNSLSSPSPPPDLEINASEVLNSLFPPFPPPTIN